MTRQNWYFSLDSMEQFHGRWLPDLAQHQSAIILYLKYLASILSENPHKACSNFTWGVKLACQDGIQDFLLDVNMDGFMNITE